MAAHMTASCLIWASPSTPPTSHLSHASPEHAQAHLEFGLVSWPALLLGTFLVSPFQENGDKTSLGKEEINRFGWLELGNEGTRLLENMGLLLGFSVLCTFLQTGLLQQMEKLQLQPLHLTFIAAAWLMQTSLEPVQGHHSPVSHHTFHEYHHSIRNESSINKSLEAFDHIRFIDPNGTYFQDAEEDLFTNRFAEFVERGIRGWSAIYRVESTSFGLCVMAATLLFSPWTLFDGILGTVFVQIFALILTESTPFHKETKEMLLADEALVLNGLLAFVALNFFLLSSVWTKIVGVVSTAMIVVIMRAWTAFRLVKEIEDHISLMTLPYVMVTFGLMMMATMRSPLRRIDVSQLSYPEMHRRLFRGGNCVDDDANVFVN